MLQRPEREKDISFCQRSWIFFKLVYEVNSEIFTIRALISLNRMVPATTPLELSKSRPRGFAYISLGWKSEIC